jgi:hypothetical protein
MKGGFYFQTCSSGNIQMKRTALKTTLASLAAFLTGNEIS